MTELLPPQIGHAVEGFTRPREPVPGTTEYITRKDQQFLEELRNRVAGSVSEADKASGDDIREAIMKQTRPKIPSSKPIIAGTAA